MKLKRVVKKDGSIIFLNAETNQEVFINGYTKKLDSMDKLNKLRESYLGYETEKLITIANDKIGDYTKEAIAIAKEILEERLYINCKSCGLKMPSHFQFCNNCGAKITKRRTCKKCNYVFELNGNFCPNCGDKI